jgi:HME family heavy-metal exporter
VVRLSDRDRTTEGLGELLVATPQGHVPLRLVATVEEVDGPNQVLREGGQRRIVISGNGDGARDMAAIAADLRRVIAEHPLPTGHAAVLEGNFRAQEEATRTIGLLSLVSLALVFVVLRQRYRSTALALVVMGNIPLALIGSVAALWIAGLPLSVASMVGFITLAGISARNGILKVGHTLNLALHEGERWGRGLILRGSEERVAPVLMTALSAGLALIPLLFGAGEPGREILHPVAVTIFGGLVSATLLDAMLTPLLFRRFGRPALESLLAERDALPAGRPAETF